MGIAQHGLRTRPCSANHCALSAFVVPTGESLPVIGSVLRSIVKSSRQAATRATNCERATVALQGWISSRLLYSQRCYCQSIRSLNGLRIAKKTKMVIPTMADLEAGTQKMVTLPLTTFELYAYVPGQDFLGLAFSMINPSEPL